MLGRRVHKFLCMIGIHFWSRPYLFDDNGLFGQLCIVCYKSRTLKRNKVWNNDV